jgi:hypothetical protein
VSEEELGLCFLGSEKTYNFWARTSEVKYSPLHEESLERQKVFFFSLLLSGQDRITITIV